MKLCDFKEGLADCVSELVERRDDNFFAYCSKQIRTPISTNLLTIPNNFVDCGKCGSINITEPRLEVCMKR